jgi:hypothetical protein
MSLGPALRPQEQGGNTRRETTEQVLDGFYLQANKAIAAGTIVIKVGKYKGFREEGGENKKDRQDNEKRPVPQESYHRAIIPDSGIFYKAAGGGAAIPISK